MCVIAAFVCRISSYAIDDEQVLGTASDRPDSGATRVGGRARHSGGVTSMDQGLVIHVPYLGGSVERPSENLLAGDEQDRLRNLATLFQYRRGQTVYSQGEHLFHQQWDRPRFPFRGARQTPDHFLQSPRRFVRTSGDGTLRQLGRGRLSRKDLSPLLADISSVDAYQSAS